MRKVRVFANRYSAPTRACWLYGVAIRGSGRKIDGAIVGDGADWGPPCAATKRLVAKLPSATCWNPRDPSVSIARVMFARTYRSKKTPYPARRTHLAIGFQARPTRGLKLFVS